MPLVLRLKQQTSIPLEVDSVQVETLRDQSVLSHVQARGHLAPVFRRFYLLWLQEMGFFGPDECFSAEIRRYCGDFLELGKGEILIRGSS
jgi:hypothetical protein